MFLFLSIAHAQVVPAEPLDLYLAQRLDVIETGVSMVYAKGYDHSGRFWFVVDARGRPIDAVDLSTRLGDDGVATEVRKRRARWNRAGAGVGGVGLVVLGVGMVVALPVAPIGAAGVVAGTLMLSKGLRERHPSTAYTEDEARSKVTAYNARIRDEILGP